MPKNSPSFVPLISPRPKTRSPSQNRSTKTKTASENGAGEDLVRLLQPLAAGLLPGDRLVLDVVLGDVAVERVEVHDVRRVDVAGDDRLVRDLGGVVGGDDPIPLVRLVVERDVLGVRHGLLSRSSDGCCSAPSAVPASVNRAGSSAPSSAPPDGQHAGLLEQRQHVGRRPALDDLAVGDAARSRCASRRARCPRARRRRAPRPVCVPRTTECAATWSPSLTMFVVSISKLQVRASPRAARAATASDRVEVARAPAGAVVDERRVVDELARGRARPRSRAPRSKRTQDRPCSPSDEPRAARSSAARPPVRVAARSRRRPGPTMGSAPICCIIPTMSSSPQPSVTSPS